MQFIVRVFAFSFVPRCRRDFFSDMQGRHRISSGTGFVWCAHSGQSNEYHTQRAYSRHLNIYLYSRFFLQSTRNLLKEYTSQTEQMCLCCSFFARLPLVLFVVGINVTTITGDGYVFPRVAKR